MHTINFLKSAPIDVVLITAADKLSNFRTTYEQLLKIGDAAWTKFNLGKEQQQWYMQSLAAVFLSRADEKDRRTSIFQKVDEVV